MAMNLCPVNVSSDFLYLSSLLFRSVRSFPDWLINCLILEDRNILRPLYIWTTTVPFCICWSFNIGYRSLFLVPYAHMELPIKSLCSSEERSILFCPHGWLMSNETFLLRCSFLSSSVTRSISLAQTGQYGAGMVGADLEIAHENNRAGYRPSSYIVEFMADHVSCRHFYR